MFNSNGGSCTRRNARTQHGGGCLYPASLAEWFLSIWGGGWWQPLPAANLAAWGWPLRWVWPAGSSRPTLLEGEVDDTRHGMGDLAYPNM